MTSPPASPHRWATRHGLAALALWAGTISLVIIGVIGDLEHIGPVDIAWVGSILVMATVGAVVGSRVPGNPIGWIFLGTSLFAGLDVGLSWAAAASASPAFAEFAEWMTHWMWIPLTVVPVTFILLLFPNGKLISRRWRIFPWVAGVGTFGSSLGTAFGEFLGASSEYGPNPYHLEDLADAVELVGSTSVLLVLVGLIASVASVTIRFRRARGIERQQLKGLAYAVAITVAGFLAGLVGWALRLDIDSEILNATVLIGPFVIPMAIGVALLRYRLYDIDRVINRTIVYALVTATLFAVYAGLAIGLPQLLPITLGSDLATAGATLVVAALFRPASQRIQSFVDRRFYRLHYDARRILEGFSGRLSHQVDIHALSGEIGAVIGDTMHPAHVTLWLREKAMAQHQQGSTL